MERMMRKIKNRLAKKANRSGFSLVEALVAIMILLMVGIIVAAGYPVAQDAYNKVVLASNAEVLLSTAVSTLRNELGTAQDIEISFGDEPGDITGNLTTGDTITYYNTTRGAGSRISVNTETMAAAMSHAAVGDEPGETEEPLGIMFQRYYSGDTDYKNSVYDAVRLVSKETATADLYVTYDTVSYDKGSGIITFKDLQVKREAGDKELTDKMNLSIRVF